MSRRRLPVGAIIALAAGIAVAVLVTRGDDGAARIAGLPDRLLALDHVSMTQRTSMRSPDGTVRYTDAAAQLDLRNDRSHVDLPDVIRDGTLELVSEGLTLYLSVPTDLSHAFDGARWLRVDTGSRAEARGASLSAVPDPTTALLALSGATGDVTDLGRDDLDGIEVRGSRASIDPARMADDRDVIASANALGRISLAWTADVWLADDGLPRRIVLRTDDVTGAPDGTRITVELRVGELDVPVRIGIPPRAATRAVASVREALVLLEAA